MIKPVLDGKAASIEIRSNAEAKYVEQLQADLRKMVWGARKGHSWYVDEGEKGAWNASMYPWWQIYFWYRSVFPTWSDWNLRK
jgi:hypothetical protein